MFLTNPALAYSFRLSRSSIKLNNKLQIASATAVDAQELGNISEKIFYYNTSS